MPQRPPAYQRFFAELKRRRVFRVVAVYGAMAFGLIEAADLIFPRLGLPDFTVTLVVWLAFLAFPVVTALTWAFDLTPEGLQRTEAAPPWELHQIVTAPALKRWSSGVFALVGMTALLAGAWFAGRQTAPSRIGFPASGPVPVPESIAVLPFLDLSEEGDQEYLSEGLAEELLNLLAKIPELRVAARTSSFSFKDKSLQIPEIGRLLNVAHVLEGSVRKAGNEVRVTAQLIRADNGYQVWSENWDRELDDIFAIEDEIAAAVVKQMEITLLGGAPTVQETDPEAYSLYLQARQLGRLGTPEGWEESNALYEAALAIDSTYAPAWAELARNYTNQAGNGERPVEDGSLLARDAAIRALVLDPGYGPAHAVLGLLAMNFGGDLEAAARNFSRALALDPTNPDILSTSASLAQNLGRMDEAIQLKEYLVARDPVNVRGQYNLGISYVFADRYDEAVESFQAALRLSPDLIGGHYFIGVCRLLQGDAEEALSSFSQEADEEYRVKGTALAFFALGRTAEYEAALQELREGWGEQWPSEVAHVYAWTGDQDSAFEWLDRAVAANEDGITDQFLWPWFRPLRDDPRWERFRERTGTSARQLAAIEFEVTLPRQAGTIR
jgi:TolB-like protein/lipoprotein NlpI